MGGIILNWVEQSIFCKNTIKTNILQKHKKTYGCAQVGNLTSNSSVADLINKYTHMDKGDYQSTWTKVIFNMDKGDIYISIIDLAQRQK